jgi:hemerythrin-like domain-containing protein
MAIQGKSKHYDMISLLQSEQDGILDKLVELRSLVSLMDSGKEDEDLLKKIHDLNDYILKDLAKYFCMEEDFLFPELEKVLPNPSSAAVMRDEHAKILTLSNAIQEMLVLPGEQHVMEKKLSIDKEMLQSEIISLIDILERHLHKKNRVLYYEAQSLLAPAVQEEIYSKLCKRLDV